MTLETFFFMGKVNILSHQKRTLGQPKVYRRYTKGGQRGEQGEEKRKEKPTLPKQKTKSLIYNPTKSKNQPITLTSQQYTSLPKTKDYLEKKSSSY